METSTVINIPESMGIRIKGPMYAYRVHSAYILNSAIVPYQTG